MTQQMTHRLALMLGVAMVTIVGFAQTGWALSISEVEGNDTFATAQSLDGFFSTDSVTDIFDSTTVPHVSVAGTIPARTDVDYYSFTVPVMAVTGYFDIDCGDRCGVDVDTILTLFDSGFNVLAHIDDSSSILDPGSVRQTDSFIGTFTFATAGTHYIAVTNFANEPLVLGTFVGVLTRPDGNFGGFEYAGDSGPTAFDMDGRADELGDYILHASLSQVAAVPEPSSLLLLGSGLLGLAGWRWRATRAATS